MQKPYLVLEKTNSYLDSREEDTMDMGNSGLSLSCVSAMAIDHLSNKVLYTKNVKERLKVASLTKIVTAIIAIESGNLNDLVTIPSSIKSIRGSVVPLMPGTKITLEELLYGLLLKSGNDAAYVIAEHFGGKVEHFIKLMNDKAKKIGAVSTNFTNPNGLDYGNNFSTAEDLVKLAAYAMNYDLFANIVSTRTAALGKTGPFSREYKNTNLLLFTSETIDGVKTGKTPGAGQCLIASEKHSSGRIITVVLKSKDRWKDTEKLLAYAKQKI
jgi:serine-type D-Ala-D-Ala carboxypeptidase (penicillin-binding protein 5/6)